MSDRKCPPHKPNGYVCLVGHWRNGVQQPQCFQCSECGHWIEHDAAEKDCDGCRKADNMKLGLCPEGHMTVEHPTREGWRKCVECSVEYGDGIITDVWGPNK